MRSWLVDGSSWKASLKGANAAAYDWGERSVDCSVHRWPDTLEGQELFKWNWMAVSWWEWKSLNTIYGINERVKEQGWGED